MAMSRYSTVLRRAMNRQIISSMKSSFMSKNFTSRNLPTLTWSKNSTIIIFRSFATDHHAGGKEEPFLDPKLVTERIIEVVKNFEKVNPIKVTPEARFKDDLDLDSLDAVEVVMAIEEEFTIEIPDSEADKILSIPDAVHYICNHPAAK